MSAALSETRRSLRDVGFLVAFRRAGMRGSSRRTANIVASVFVVLTLCAAILPAFSPGTITSSRALDMLVLLPTAFLAFAVTTTFAIIGAGGGRELLLRDEGVAFPVSPTTDHVGALLLAPFNIAWMLQAWTLLGFTAYATGPTKLWTVQITVMLWLLAATALAQAVAWCVEWIRRGRHGIAIIRTMGIVLGLAVAGLVASDHVSGVLDRSPTLQVVLVALHGRDGDWLPWLIGLAVLAAMFFAAVAVGARVNHAVSRRPPREEMKEAGRAVTPREMARNEFAALVRTDRASVWRSVALRRGFVVLALLPGLVAAAGQLEWSLLPILPGLVAAGGALLFGINAWCLDATGALWRDSLPVRPELVFAARVCVLLEVLLVATVLTLLVAGTRAGGVPTSAEVASLIATIVVVSLQVTARAMHWSVRRPFAMDLRSSRGTPAPPSVMVGYSSYLALTSTLTGMVFTVTAQASDPTWAIVFAAPFALLAIRRLVITAGEWATPEVRARVVATVSAH
ncbi:MAG: hypothetical protein ABJA81_00075 [Nocardioidaceae bacterium]